MKKRIAILGGGMGSLVTAFELTNLVGWRDRYDITVYQEGWRLGGKGASGRNAAEHDRIEEHGLHILFGFYENAFRVMRHCYRELGRHPGAPLSSWEQAFVRDNLIVMMEKLPDDSVPGGVRYEPWRLEAPFNDELPGETDEVFTPWDFVKMLLRWSAAQVHRLTPFSDAPEVAVMRHASIANELPRLRDQVRRLSTESERPSILDALTRALGDVLRATAGVVLAEASELLYLDFAYALSLDDSEDDNREIVWLLEQVRSYLFGDALTLSSNAELRRLRMMLDFALAVIRGLIVDRLIAPPYDWFSIDDLDLRAWLKKHGAHDDTLASPMVQGLYDAAFSTWEPSAAGTSLHGFLRMAFTYKGGILWKMQGGMGDVIFAPLYTVLERRGVKFELFHQVHALELSSDRKSIERVKMGKQATPKTGSYDPLVDVKGLPCWPSHPIYEQLVEGEQLRAAKTDLEDWWADWRDVGSVTLERGRDFDLVVLGISIGAFPSICKQLVDDANNPRFKAMVEGVKTTQTQAAQLWLTPDVTRLGAWERPPVVIPHVEPFDTWADMSHLLPLESWPASCPVGHLAYLCSAMQDDEPLPDRNDHQYPVRQNERVRKHAIEWLTKSAGGVWPNATTTHDPCAINWWWLADAQNRRGEARLAAQFWRAPVSPSERYVLAVPGSSRKRLRADESGYDNLYMCGDWTLTAMSVGCLEGATMGGIQAARAIDPQVPRAFGDWLPEDRTITPAPPARPAAAPAPRVVRPEQLPAYITTDGNQIASPPIRLGITVYMFLLDADYGKLAAICDRELNLGGEATYRPLGPFVVMYCSKVDNYPLVDPIGWVPEKDFGIWMPVVGGRSADRRFIPDRLLTYTPYIWVDNGVALIGGRTVFGFAKQIGNMTLPARPTDEARFTLDTLVVPDYAPDAMAVEKRLLSIARKDGGLFEDLIEVWRTGSNVLDAFGDVVSGYLEGGDLPVPSFTFARELLSQMQHGMRMVFLKQFPDATDATKACYQAIVEADLPITSGITGGKLPGDYEIEVHGYDSHRIVETLGLRPARRAGRVATLDSLAHGWTKFEARVEPGTIVWPRPQTR